MLNRLIAEAGTHVRFMIMSGQMPWSLNGMSACSTMSPTTPFWPWRDENLSPSSGRRVCRMSTLISSSEAEVLDTITRSTAFFSAWAQTRYTISDA